MGKEFITYQQAVKLKELGFDEPCFATYNNDKKISRNPSHNMEDLLIEGKPYYWNNSKVHISCITAPLKQQVFRYFRNNYNLQSEIHFNPLTEKWRLCEIIALNNNNKVIYDGENEFKLYEEAESSCIDELIKIIQNK